MLGFRLFFYAMQSLARDFFPLLGLSFLPGVGAILLFTSLDTYADTLLNQDFAFYLRGPVFVALITPLIGWAAMNWQRAVILGQKPTIFPGWALIKYSWRLGAIFVLLGILTVMYFYAIDFLITETGFARGTGFILILGSFALIIGYLFGMSYIVIRLGFCLAGTAIGQNTSMAQGWRQTTGYSLPILIMSFLNLLIIIPALVAVFALSPNSYWGFYLFIWITMVLFCAVVTELYRYATAQNDVTEVFG